MKQFRILITGSRTWDDYNTIRDKIIDAIKDYIELHQEVGPLPVNSWLTIVHGNCPKGADRLADIFASMVLKCKIERYDADWAQHGRKAGFVRNRRMVNTAPDICLAFIRDRSKGASGCYDLAKKAGIPSDRFLYEDYNDTSS
jgi:SLOG family YspA-like protein